MTGPVPPSAARISDAVGRGDTPAVEVVEAHLAAVAAGAGLNAFTLVDAEQALARASGIDAAVAAGEDPGPLAGVPVALKDLVDHTGRPTTCGSGFYREVAAASATVVERIEAAGGIVIGRTGLHEFAFGFSSENHWFGPVRNPWDPTLSPGGSSGGSAAAVAAGMAPVAVGTDTGGSVRVPAALCGIAGLKVTHGRVPLRGVFPLASSLDTVGPLARSIEDLALLYRVMAGDDPRDPWSVPQPVTVPSAPHDLGGLRIGVPAEWVDTPLDADTRAGFTSALEAIAAAGAAVVEESAPLLRPGPEITASFKPEVARVHRRRFAEHRDRYGPDVAERMAPMFEDDADEYQAALEWRAALRGIFGRLFEQFDVLATPTVAARRKHIGEEEAESETGPVPYRGAFSRFTALVNHASLPAIALPLATAGEPPPSLQLIGPAWSENMLLGIGWALEDSGIVEYRTPPAGASF